MIITVTPNPALDLTWHLDCLEAGETHRADAARVRAGGKGLNVARILHAEGDNVLAITTCGGSSGTEFSKELRQSGVPHRLIPVARPTRRSLALVDVAAGEATVINERGDNPAEEEWGRLRKTVAGALAASPDPRNVLVLSGSLAPGAPEDLFPSLVSLGKEAGALVIADTSGPALLHAAGARADVLKPNAEELFEATGIDEPVQGALSLLQRGAQLVLLSRGSEGMLGITSEQIIRARLGSSLVGNPTGAGDAAVAACAALLHDGESKLTRLVRRATAWSAAAVLQPLAGDIDESWPLLEAAIMLDYPPATFLS